jgi:hypothetical protein
VAKLRVVHGYPSHPQKGWSAATLFSFSFSLIFFFKKNIYIIFSLYIYIFLLKSDTGHIFMRNAKREPFLRLMSVSFQRGTDNEVTNFELKWERLRYLNNLRH